MPFAAVTIVSAVITIHSPSIIAEKVRSSLRRTSTDEPEVPSGMLSAGGKTYSALNMPSSLTITVYMLPFSAVTTVPLVSAAPLLW